MGSPSVPYSMSPDGFEVTSDENGFGARGLTASPLRGPAGNVEFLAELRLGETGAEPGGLIEAALGDVA
ncbi:MAG: hypothetical protein ABR609_09795 [Acidimicrobiia bacterium]